MLLKVELWTICPFGEVKRLQFLNTSKQQLYMYLYVDLDISLEILILL